ncbi:MAG: hypothetical protein V4436_03380 [Patescibacteria group bacterium]
MSKFISEKMVYKFSFIIAWVSVLVVFGFIAVQAYVRWTINQEFTFLGGFGLEALTLGAFGLLAALLFAKNRD